MQVAKLAQSILLGTVLMSLSLGCTKAQTAKTAETQDVATPKTKLERFVAQDGAVIIRGFSSMGKLKGNYGGSVEVEAKEFVNVTTGKKERGITVEVKETLRFERTHTSYVDLDELDSLLKGLDYIARANKSVTKLDNFQADYRSRGDLVVSTFSDSQGGVNAAVSSGVIGKTDAILDLSDLTKLREIVAAAQARLVALQ
jgi:hypothetical protein